MNAEFPINIQELYESSGSNKTMVQWFNQMKTKLGLIANENYIVKKAQGPRIVGRPLNEFYVSEDVANEIREDLARRKK